ncbi:MAG: hypothetical protein ACRD0L_10370, partial [Acidimicrobiales bacterium]
VDWRGPAARRLSAASAELAGRRHTVEALDPARVLGRGYAVVRGPGGGVLRDPGAVVAGDVLGVTLARGGLLAAVLEEEAAEGRAAGRA